MAWCFETGALRSRSNVEFPLRRTKLQFESIQLGKARPFGQTSNFTLIWLRRIERVGRSKLIDELRWLKR